MLVEQSLTRKGFSGLGPEKQWLSFMPQSELRYSLNAIKQAGKDLRDGCQTWDQLISAQEKFENWRDCHLYPLSQFYDSLQQYAKMVNPAINVVQRPKRQQAIIDKLKRYPTMALTTMQDIAGCRTILPHISSVAPFVEVCKAGWSQHELFKPYNYIANPREDGYRSLHLTYRFRSDNPTFNGRFVEIQFRSRFQHYWATALETVDLFENERLKAGAGSASWSRFFALMGSVVAAIEGTTRIPGTPIDEFDEELRKEVTHYAKELNVEARMRAYGSLAYSIPDVPIESGKRTGVSGFSGVSGYSGATQPEYFLMELSSNSKRIQVRGYERGDIAQASKDLAIAERGNQNVVLVAASDLSALKEAYPNWIIDTRNFVSLLQHALLPES